METLPEEISINILCRGGPNAAFLLCKGLTVRDPTDQMIAEILLSSRFYPKEALRRTFGRAWDRDKSERLASIVRHMLRHPTLRRFRLFRHPDILISAAEHGHAEVVRLLLGYGRHASRADCQYGDALVAAAKNGHAEVVRTLLEWPVHAPSADCQHGRALNLAARYGHTEVVRTLMAAVQSCGASVRLKRAYGYWNALDWAKDRGDTEAVRILTEPYV